MGGAVHAIPLLPWQSGFKVSSSQPTPHPEFQLGFLPSASLVNSDHLVY